jgi:hypothetical protein
LHYLLIYFILEYEKSYLVFFSVDAANALKLNSVEKELGAAGECSPSTNFEIEMHKTNF